MTRTWLFHPSPSGETRWDIHAWLWAAGCELHTHRVYVGCDGLWRGSGVQVVRG